MKLFLCLSFIKLFCRIEQFKELSSVCKQELEQLLQLSGLTDELPALQLRLILLQQLLHLANAGYNNSLESTDVTPFVHFVNGWHQSKHCTNLPADLLPLITRCTKMVAQFNTSVTEGTIYFVLP